MGSGIEPLAKATKSAGRTATTDRFSRKDTPAADAAGLRPVLPDLPASPPDPRSLQLLAAVRLPAESGAGRLVPLGIGAVRASFSHSVIWPCWAPGLAPWRLPGLGASSSVG